MLGLLRVELRISILRAGLPPTVVHHLDRHLAASRCVCEIDGAEAAAAELADDIIAWDRRQRNGCDAELGRSECNGGRAL